MDDRINRIKKTGIDTTIGLDYTGKPEMYLSAIRRFGLAYEKNREMADGYLSAGEIADYRTLVHSLKSNAKMIGALDLSIRFADLEALAREENLPAVRQKHPAVFDQYYRLIIRLVPICGEEPRGEAAPEISAEEAGKKAKALLEALDDFDDEEAKELVQKLSAYPFASEQAAALKRAAAFIDDFMYDDAAEQITLILPGIR